MRKIKEVFALEIAQGYANWEVMEKKIHAALNLVDNSFKILRQEGEEDTPVKMPDAVAFRVKKPHGEFCYEIASPRLRNGELWCSGLNVGGYNPEGVPIFFSKGVSF